MDNPIHRREMIKVMCGEVVYPWEIENVIAEDPAVGEISVRGFVDAAAGRGKENLGLATALPR